MKKILLFIFLFLFSFSKASDLNDKIRALTLPNVYKNNENFIKKIFSDERSFYKNNKLDVTKIVKTLKTNGLLNIKLPSPSNVNISFRINHSYVNDDKEPSFMFLSYATSNLLANMGYKYFYTTRATKQDSKISITYAMQSESNIDPVLIIDNLYKRGYSVIDITKDSNTHWIYDIVLNNTTILDANFVKKGSTELAKTNGKYWLMSNNEGILNITPKDNIKWYPKILVFDSNMNIIKSVMMTNPSNNYSIDITNDARYIMITDNYKSTILNNGIVLNFKGK